MCGRFVSVWFRHLTTDWMIRRQPVLKDKPFVFTTTARGRTMITAVSEQAERSGIATGMVLADARAILPGLQHFEEDPDLPERLLKNLAEWCIRYTPFVAIDGVDGLILDASGCTHLWGGENRT